jgi:hypothetical protein
MKCIHCDIDFDPKEKNNVARVNKLPAGKINECLDCASEEPERYTGVMIYGHKTGGEIQINSDPSLTEYMKNAGGARIARSLGKTSQYDMPKTTDAVKKVVKDVAKRR